MIPLEVLKACMLTFFAINLYGKFMEIIGLKALGNLFASICTYNFPICLWENPNTLISMNSGFSNVSPTFNIALFLSLETSRHLKPNQETTIDLQETLFFCKSQNYGNPRLPFLEKTDAGKSPRSVE